MKARHILFKLNQGAGEAEEKEVREKATKVLEEARQAAKAIRYPPEGVRGVARMVRATNYASDFSEYYANQKKNLVCIVQIETEEIKNSLD